MIHFLTSSGMSERASEGTNGWPSGLVAVLASGFLAVLDHSAMRCQVGVTWSPPNVFMNYRLFINLFSLFPFTLPRHFLNFISSSFSSSLLILPLPFFTCSRRHIVVIVELFVRVDASHRLLDAASVARRQRSRRCPRWTRNQHQTLFGKWRGRQKGGVHAVEKQTDPERKKKH